MHLAFYRERDDVEAVIHAHPPVATAFACAGWALDELICQEAAMTLGPVPLARYATTGTDEVAESLRPLIPAYDTILLANHGAVACGANCSAPSRGWRRWSMWRRYGSLHSSLAATTPWSRSRSANSAARGSGICRTRFECEEPAALDQDAGVDFCAWMNWSTLLWSTRVEPVSMNAGIGADGSAE